MAIAEDMGTPGIRFNPTNEELVGHYLLHKIRGNNDLVSAIAEIDYICKYEPWDLPLLAAIPSKDTWHFFSRPDRKNRKTGTINRVTRAGFWKVTGKERLINTQVIGFKRVLVFYSGRVRNPKWTNWTIHEFYLKSSDSNGEDYVISRLHRKPPKKTVNSVVDEGEPGHDSASEVENPLSDISFPEIDPHLMEEILDWNWQDFTSPIAQQPVMHMSQDPPYVNLQYTNGATVDCSRSLSPQDNTEAVKFYPADVDLYCGSYAASNESRSSVSSSSLHIGDTSDAEVVKPSVDGCLPEMHMMQGMSCDNLQQTNCVADECNLIPSQFGTTPQQDDISELKSYPAIQDAHSYGGSMQIAPSDSSPSKSSGSQHVEDISNTEADNPMFACFDAAPQVDNDWLWDWSFEPAPAYFP